MQNHEIWLAERTNHNPPRYQSGFLKWRTTALTDHVKPQRNAMEKRKEKLNNQVLQGRGLKQLRGNLCSKNLQKLSLVGGSVSSNIFEPGVHLLMIPLVGRWFDKPSWDLTATAWSGRSLMNAQPVPPCNWVGEFSQRKIQLFLLENKGKWMLGIQISSCPPHCQNKVNKCREREVNMERGIMKSIQTRVQWWDQ